MSVVEELSQEIDELLKSLPNNTVLPEAAEPEAARRDEHEPGACGADTANESAAEDEDESAESLIARAEQMLEESRRERALLCGAAGTRNPRRETETPVETNAAATEVHQRFNISFDGLYHSLSQLVHETEAALIAEEAVSELVIAESAASGASALSSISINNSTIVIADVDESDEDVVFVNTAPSEYVPVVDLCTPDETHHAKRLRPNRLRPISIDLEPTNASVCRASTSASRMPKSSSVAVPDTEPPRSSPRIEDKNCAICMDLPFNNQPTSTLCGHIFCGSCIRQAITMYKKCPICNRKLTIKQIHPIFF